MSGHPAPSATDAASPAPPASVPLRPFGNSGEHVTALGLGGAFLSRQGSEEGIRTIHAALEMGVRYFDTSPMYLKGASQPLLGEALAGRSEPHFLATKIGYLGDRARFRDPAAIEAQIHDNLRLLRRDQVDLLQIHEADTPAWWTGPQEHRFIRPDEARDYGEAPVTWVLQQAKERGICRYTGISGNSAEGLCHVVDHLSLDQMLLAFNYDTVHRGAVEHAVPRVQRRGLALVAAGILQSGRMLAIDPAWFDQPPKWLSPQLVPRAKDVYELQRQSGLSLPEMTLRFLLADERISVIVLGAATVQQVREAVEAHAKGPLPPDLHAALVQLREKHPA